jgi:hypothetical protein
MLCPASAGPPARLGLSGFAARRLAPHRRRAGSSAAAPLVQRQRGLAEDIPWVRHSFMSRLRGEGCHSLSEPVVVLALVAALMFLLFAIIRFSVVSPVKTRGWKGRLRYPKPEGIARVCGFPPPQELIDFYRQAPFIDSVEFYLVDHSREPVAAWSIGAFSPLTPLDVREQRKISGVAGIPIADDLDKGTYFVASSGAVMLRSPNVPGGETEVATSITSFASFEARDRPLGEGGPTCT